MTIQQLPFYKSKQGKSIILTHRFPLVYKVKVPGNYLYHLEEWFPTLLSLECTDIAPEIPTRQYDCLQSLTIILPLETSMQHIYFAFPNVNKRTIFPLVFFS